MINSELPSPSPLAVLVVSGPPSPTGSVGILTVIFSVAVEITSIVTLVPEDGIIDSVSVISSVVKNIVCVVSDSLVVAACSLDVTVSNIVVDVSLSVDVISDVDSVTKDVVAVSISADVDVAVSLSVNVSSDVDTLSKDVVCIYDTLVEAVSIGVVCISNEVRVTGMFVNSMSSIVVKTVSLVVSTDSEKVVCISLAGPSVAVPKNQGKIGKL